MELYEKLPDVAKEKLNLVKDDLALGKLEALVKKELEAIPDDEGGDMGTFRINAQGHGGRAGRNVVPEEVKKMVGRVGYTVQHLPDMAAKWDPTEGSAIGLPMPKFFDNLRKLTGVLLHPKNDPGGSDTNANG